VADADKIIKFVGSSLKDLTAFPDDAKRIAGHQLHRVQKGLTPDTFKPMPTVGQGVQEIIITTDDAFRVFYVAKFEEAIYVLHAFQKKTQKTSSGDILRGRMRYAQVVQQRKQPGS
jgi:phage-related protein